MKAQNAATVLCTVVWLVGSAAVVRSEPPTAKVRVTLISVDGSTTEVREGLQDRQLFGDYRLGDGLGYNLSLSLKDGGKFECQWIGCLGVYGTSSGAWTIQDTGLKLDPKKADGMFKDRPIDRLRILSFQKNYLLLQERDSEWFKKYGPDTFCCFHQAGARKALAEHERRRIEQEVKDEEKKTKK